MAASTHSAVISCVCSAVFISAPAPPAPAAPVVTVRQEIQDGAGHSTVFINDSQTNVSRDS